MKPKGHKWDCTHHISKKFFQGAHQLDQELMLLQNKNYNQLQNKLQTKCNQLQNIVAPPEQNMLQNKYNQLERDGYSYNVLLGVAVTN